ncbi:unnamed protein product [Dovyalis caffra]|uniref:Serine aminopeptidase S33 domain-containing protein n=1 Tax=Dovyalis caffra TaxID=77055 RepID=A0AAV1QU71_9ROSI|nr:unnamed protein product [Dovyalis caffra]
MDSSSSFSPYILLFNALSQIPTWHYLVALLIISITFLYNFLEIHFFEDAFFKFQGTPITYNPSSPICNAILSNCKILHSRFVATPWLSSPHLQTSFMQFFGRSPIFSYRRLLQLHDWQMFYTSDGGTIALDWLMKSDGTYTALDINKSLVSGGAFHINGAFLPMNNAISQDETTPTVVVVPGLASDSTSNQFLQCAWKLAAVAGRSSTNESNNWTSSKNNYLKNLAFNMAKHGWNVVVCNHRGLGGVSITSDCFYNAGWTEDLRAVIKYLHNEYPKAPLFAIGTSIGANILVKYLGEDGARTPVAGAAAVCNPWDLLIGDRFICRRLLQRIYDRALTIGLQGYAQLYIPNDLCRHEPLYTRLANWEGIKKTVDTYYRRCSSAAYVGNVSVPLLCISALDDPLCTREAIPWDECRGNPNIVLATPQHGGHLAFFEGLTATSFWWIRAVDEFLGVLRSSRYMHVQKKQTSGQRSVLDSAIDQHPHLHVSVDGIVTPAGSEEKRDEIEGTKKLQMLSEEKTNEMLSNAEHDQLFTEATSDFMSKTAQTSEEAINIQDAKSPEKASNIQDQDAKSPDITVPVRRFLNQISQQKSISMWLLAFLAIKTSWPLVRSAFNFIFRKRSRKFMPAA